MKEYFYKQEYKYMYLAKISYNFANALIETFGTVMLYKWNFHMAYFSNLWIEIWYNRTMYSIIHEYIGKSRSGKMCFNFKCF